MHRVGTRTRMLPTSLPLVDLAQQCAEQTELYRRRRTDSDSRFCFELLRRALREGLAEAFTWVCRIYEPQVTKWVYRHGGFSRTSETADYFAYAALAQMYFGLLGPKFDRMPSLASVLAYLKACVHSSIAQYLRDQLKSDWTELDEQAAAPTVDLAHRVEASELWAHLCRLLPDPHDQRLAHACFVLGLKPAEIVGAYPGLWRNEREISVDLYRIRGRLRRDPELRQRLGAAPAGEDL